MSQGDLEPGMVECDAKQFHYYYYYEMHITPSKFGKSVPPLSKFTIYTHNYFNNFNVFIPLWSVILFWLNCLKAEIVFIYVGPFFWVGSQVTTRF